MQVFFIKNTIYFSYLCLICSFYVRSNLGLINGCFGVDCVSVIVFFTVDVCVFLSIPPLFFSELVVVRVHYGGAEYLLFNDACFF